MKIAYVLPAISAGGAERITIHLANAFAEAGHEVTLFVGFPSPWEAGRGAGIARNVVVEFMHGRSQSQATMYVRSMAWMYRHHRRLCAFDVVHCHLTYGAFIGTLLDAWRRLDPSGHPLIVETYHAVGMRIPALRRFLHALSTLRRDVLVLMASDSFWARFTARHPRLTSRTILNGASAPDLSRFDAGAGQAYRRALGIPDSCRFIVGSVGMLRPDREPAVFLPIIARLVERYGDLHWLYAGDGPERQRLEAAIRAAGLDKSVRITGVIRDVAEPLSVMDLYVTLAVGDVFGVAALEAALAGIPVIGVQLVRGFESNPRHWAWSSDDRNQVADMALELLADTAKRSALAERQQRYVRAHHSVEAMARSYAEVYEEGLAALRRAAVAQREPGSVR